MNHPYTRPWQVIHDPQRIYKGAFRELDLRLTAEAGYWPDGIIFEHQRTGERRIFLNGSLVSLPRQENIHETLH